MRSLKYILAVIIALVFNNLQAQQSGTNLVRNILNSPGPGKVKIVQDDQIISLIDNHLYEESRNKGIAGYRIRIYSNSGKQAFSDGPRVQAEFENRYAGVSTHYFFDSPFHRVYVGDFRTHSEAMKFLKEIERYYPDAFIVRSKIDYPPLKF